MSRIARVFLVSILLVAGVANAEDRSAPPPTSAPLARAAEPWSPPSPRHWQAPLQFLSTGVQETLVAGHDSRTLDSSAASSRVAMARTTTPLFGSTPQTLGFVAVAPCRQYDSRNATPLAQGTSRNITLTGAPCGIPAGAPAVSVNIAVFNINGASSNGVFTVGIPFGTSQAFLNYPPGQAQIDNAGAVTVDGTGALAVTVNQGGGSVDFVADVNGYYTSTGTVSGVETLGIARGIVASADGSLFAGSGFTSARTSAGRYSITFSPAFSGFPTVTLTLLQATGGTAVIDVLTLTSFTFVVYNPAGVPADLGYTMITAIGPP